MYKRKKYNINKSVAAIPKRDTNRQWSNLQKDIFNHVKNGDGNAVVLAAPGSGKTTTIEESLYHIPKGERSLYLAFNKSIADEFTLKAPIGTDSRTFHRLGLETIRREWGKTYNLYGRHSIDTDDSALSNLLAEMLPQTQEVERLIDSLVLATKMSKTMLAGTHEEIEKVCCDFGIPTHGLSNTDFTDIVYRAMEFSRVTPLKLNGQYKIGFDDMIWLPHVNGWVPEQYDRVFVDEAQDLSAARVSLALKAMKSNGKICAFGDPYQCIFSFAGAKSDFIDEIINDGAKKLPLSISYRCPKRVVELAQEINPEIECGENAIDGKILHQNITDLIRNVIPEQSAILSRTNFSVIKTAFMLIQNGIKASIIGKDISNRFLWRIDDWNPSTIDELKTAIYNWRDDTIERSPSATKFVTDEANSILQFTENSSSISELKKNIKKFFKEDKTSVKLSTTHKAKGLEWDHVYLLENTFKPGESQEQNNIYYVALTRTKKTLTFVS